MSTMLTVYSQRADEEHKMIVRSITHNYLATNDQRVKHCYNMYLNPRIKIGVLLTKEMIFYYEVMIDEQFRYAVRNLSQ